MRTQYGTIPLKTYLCGALLLGAGLLPATALAQDAPTASPTTSAEGAEAAQGDPVDGAADVAVAKDIEAGAEEDEKKDWALTASLTTRLYQGMFVDLANNDANINSPNASSTSDAFSRWSNIYSVSASYKLSDFRLGAQALASHWMSRGGGMNEPYEFRFQDLVFSAGWDGYTIDAIDTKFAASYNLIAPTSTVSQTANLVVGNYLGLSLSRTFLQKLSLSYSLSAGWTPHSEAGGTIDAEDAQIYREDERVGNDVFIPGNIPTEFSLSHTFVASMPVWDKLRASVSYTYGSAWSADLGEDDEFTPNTDGIQTGRNYGDGTTATAGLSYPLNDHFQLAGSLSTSQRPKTDDNKGFRFPWWNFSGAAANRSSINLNLSATY